MKMMTNRNAPLVVALAYDGLCTFEFGIVAEIFGLDRPEMGDGWYRFETCPIEPGPLRAHGGLMVAPTGSADLIEQADIVVVPGWRGAEAPVPPELIERLRAAHARGGRLVSVCSGAFVLAATGLLDEGVATTHWRYAEALRRKHPRVSVDERSLYRSCDRVYTSAGSAAGIDLLIEIVREDFGPPAANSVARRLVMPAHRTGGQAQFVERPVRDHRRSGISPLLDELRSTLDRRWTLADMAARCGLGQRTFVRRFEDATGASPGEWLTAERVEAAKALLADTAASVDAVAEQVGFGSTDTLRHHFRRRIGISPAEYRRRFGTSQSPA